jgi:ribonuclease P protein component
MKPQGFPRALRLRKRAEFLFVQQRGHKHHVRNFLVFVTPQSPLQRRFHASGPREITDRESDDALPPTRLGVTVTRKVGGAVVRNRIKRLVRESFRRERNRFQPGLSMVWIAKRDAAAVSYSDVLEQMQTLARRLSRTPRPRPPAGDTEERA